MTIETVTLIAATIAIIIGAGTLIGYFLTVSGRLRVTGSIAGNPPPTVSSGGEEQAHFQRMEFVANDEKNYEFVGYMGL